MACLAMFDHLDKGVLVGTAQDAGSLLLFQLTKPQAHGPDFSIPASPSHNMLRAGQNSILMELRGYTSIV